MTMRVLVVVTHLLGVGHLARAAALARALAQAGHDTTLVSGGMPAALVPTDGVRVVQLPPLRSDGIDFATLLDARGMPVGTDLLAARRQMLLADFAAARPTLVVTELFPFGRRQLAAEFLALLERTRAVRPRPLVVASIRDILVPPARRERVAETHARLRDFYDAVLVHGDPRVVPLEASWPDAAEVADLLHYTGYIDPPAQEDHAATGDGAGEVLISGGGSAAGLRLQVAAIEAARLLPNLPWRILAGHGVPQGDFDRLVVAAPANVVVERARPDFPALLERCAVSVSQAGYNTMIDLIRAEVRSVVVPFEAGNETEQRMRAERFAARELVTMLAEADLSAPALAQAVAAALRGPPPAATAIDRNGLPASVALLETLAGAA